jgi:ATP-dependent helicase/nuclease subunit A
VVKVEPVGAKLSAEQIAAVRRSGQDVCVVAGPGSGKTRVLVERFAWLVEERGVDPARILAITFTEKAARMMKGRLVTRFENRPEIRERVERAWVMTIDGFCARLLREHAIEAGLAPDFPVLEAAAAERKRREAAESALDELFQEQPHAMRRLLEALALSTSDDGSQVDLAASLIEVHESMRLAGVRELPETAEAAEDGMPEARRLAAEMARDPKWGKWHDWAGRFRELADGPVTPAHFRLAAEFDPKFTGMRKAQHPHVAALRERMERLEAQWIVEWNAGLPELLRTAVARLEQRYGEAKRREAAVDFADLGEKTIELLESGAELRERIRDRFEHLLMDELQDTNRLQWKLVQLLRRPQVFFAVGDINQSIYGFRHADRAVFEEYRSELRTRSHEIDELKENYRSREEILTAVGRALDGANGVEARELVAKRPAAGWEGPAVEVLIGAGERAREMEAEAVLDRMAELRASEERPWGDFAILVRVLGAAEPFEEALEQRGIPFLVSGGRTFLEARETRDLIGLLAALVNPLDEIATAGALRGPLVGWSDEQLLRAGPAGRLEEFDRLFGGARRMAGFLPPDRILATILDECGYVGPATERARGNIDKLLSWIRREHRKRPRQPAELLEDLEALREAEGEAEAAPQQASDAVNIMTIHAAKGLEFPVVFVSGLHRRPRQSSPVLLFSKALGLGAKWRNPETGKGLKDAAHAALSEKLKQDESAEEQRLLYVAMTRAEDRLVVSYARQKNSRRTDLVKRVEAQLPAGMERVFSTFAAAAAAGGSMGSAAREEVLLEAPQVAGQYDSSAAATDVALFAACPRKYFLARYVGLQPEPEGRAGTGAIGLGLEAHKALAGEATASPEALEWKRQFDLSEMGRRAASAARAEREFDFSLAVEDVVLRGRIDLWFEEGGELVLLDYKTDKDEAGAAEYALQLRLYALALERYAGRMPDRAALCYLRSGRVLEVSLLREDLDGARRAVRGLASAQDALDFPLKAGEQCRRCWFYGGSCPAKLEEGTA